MATRTYLYGLWLVFTTAVKYAKRWQVRLQENMTVQQYACLVAVIEALDECLPLIQPNPPVD